MKKTITVKIAVEINLDAYRRDYGTSDDFADAAQYTADLLTETAEQRLEAVGGWATLDKPCTHWTTSIEKVSSS